MNITKTITKIARINDVVRGGLRETKKKTPDRKSPPNRVFVLASSLRIFAQSRVKIRSRMFYRHYIIIVITTILNSMP